MSINLQPNGLKQIRIQKMWPVLVLLLTIGRPLKSFSRESDYDLQIHAMMGVVSGEFSGPITGSFNVPQAINAELEFLSTPQRSFMIRNIIAIDAETSKNQYSATTIGQRFYWKGINMPIHIADESKTQISIRPKSRLYVGWDAGISQVIVYSLTPALDSVSTMFDIGVNLGYQKQISEKWALSTQIGYSRGFGFSTVAVSGSTRRLFAGLSYYY